MVVLHPVVHYPLSIDHGPWTIDHRPYLVHNSLGLAPNLFYTTRLKKSPLIYNSTAFFQIR